jgi:hypothetical protein
MTTFFVTGDSHVAALKRGHALLQSRGQLARGANFVFRPFGNAGYLRQPFFRREGDRIVVTEPSYVKRVPVLPPDDFQSDDGVIAISAFFHLSGLWTTALWRQGWIPGGPVGRGRAFSAGMLGEIALHRARYLLELARLLGELGHRVCAIEGPGPFSHDPAFTTVPVARVDAVRRACRDAIAGELDRIGVPVIAVPEACRNPDGVLEDLLRNEDPADTYHAGAEFGAIMLDRLQALYACPAPLNAGASE